MSPLNCTSYPCKFSSVEPNSTQNYKRTKVNETSMTFATQDKCQNKTTKGPYLGIYI